LKFIDFKKIKHIFSKKLFFVFFFVFSFFVFNTNSVFALPDFTISSVEVLGAQYSGYVNFSPNRSLQVVVTARNSGTTASPATPLTARINYKFGGMTRYTDTISNLGTSIGVGVSKVGDFPGITNGLGPIGIGNWTFEVCLDDSGSISETNEGNNCSSPVYLFQDPSLPIQANPCVANLSNHINIDGNYDWSTNTDINVTNCPVSRWQNLFVDGDADVTLSPSNVFDVALGAWRSFDVGVGCIDRNAMADADSSTIPYSGSGVGCGGRSEAQGTSLGFTTAVTDGSVLNRAYLNPLGFGSNLFRAHFLPAGNYPFVVSNTFRGEYICLPGGVETVYHGECDPNNTNWKEQFLLAINHVLVNQFGQPDQQEINTKMNARESSFSPIIILGYAFGFSFGN
jgi:hypothetical protein